MKQISLLDQLSSSISNHFKLFSDGIGDREYLETIPELTKSITPIKEIEIEWGVEKNLFIADKIDGIFESPYSEFLPMETKTSHFSFIKPKNFSKDTPIVLHLAATGEEGYLKRLYTMALPLVNYGIASILLENPYYGKRKPDNQNSFLIKTISDFFKMTTATIEEGKSLLHYFLQKGHSKLAVTGISMASLVAANSRVPIASVPCLAPYSPAPTFTEALLYSSLDWYALNKEFIAKESAFDFVKQILEEADIRKQPVPIRVDACILVGGLYDGYVTTESVEEIHKHWKGSELRWIKSGHAGSFLFHNSDFRKAIRDALDKI
jgi:hypothetical protein